MKAMLKTMVAVVACIAVLAPATVSAAGPAIAFRQDACISGLQLGAWDCASSGVVFGFNDQFIGSVRTVADGLGAGQLFCMMDRSLGSLGDWNGLLYWD